MNMARTVPALILVGGLMLAPLTFLLRMSLFEPGDGTGSFRPGTVTRNNYTQFFDGDWQSILKFTIVFAIAITLLTLTVSYPLAAFLNSQSLRFQRFGLAIVLLPKSAGLLATLFAFQRWLPRGYFGALIAEVALIAPCAILLLLIRLRAIPRHLGVAARGLGATGMQAFLRITLPLSIPAIFLAAGFAFTWGLGAFLGPLFLGTPAETTLSWEIHRQAFEYGRWPRAAAEAVGLSTLVLAGLLLTRIGSR